MGSPCKLPSASVVLPPGLGGFLSAPAEEAQEHWVTSQRLGYRAGHQQVTDLRAPTLLYPFRPARQVYLLTRTFRPKFTPVDDHKGFSSVRDAQGGVEVLAPKET